MVDALVSGASAERRASSSLVPSTIQSPTERLAIVSRFLNAAVAQLVEHQLPKLRVAGSSPVCRSKEKPNTKEVESVGSTSFVLIIYRQLIVGWVHWLKKPGAISGTHCPDYITPV